MRYIQTHRGLVSERTTIPSTSALRGRVYELSYDSKSASKNKYIVLALNIYPKSGGKSKQLLHCLDLDEMPLAEVRKIIKTANEIVTGWKGGLEHQQLIIEGRSTAIYDEQLRKLQKRIPGIYKTFKLNKITKFELTNYDFISIIDTATKKKLGVVENED